MILVCYVIGLGNSRYFLNQSDLQLKSNASFACFYFEFSLALRDIFLAMIGWTFFVLSEGGVKRKILSLHEESHLIFSDFALRCSFTKPQRLCGMKGYYRGTYALHEYNHKRTVNSWNKMRLQGAPSPCKKRTQRRIETFLLWKQDENVWITCYVHETSRRFRNQRGTTFTVVSNY